MILNIPINGTSLGQVSYNIARQFYFSRYNISGINVIADAHLGNFQEDDQFSLWLNSKIQEFYNSYSRDVPSIRLWHIIHSFESLTNKNYLLTFHETDTLTRAEINVLRSYIKVFVTSNYTKSVFESAGLDNIVYCPIGLDKQHFFKTNKKYLPDDIISFSLYGKMEERKRTLKILSCWAQKFGNNKKYRLNVLITNPFLSEDEQKKRLFNTLGENVPWNINFINYHEKNSVYNEILNASDIDLTGLSGCEGFNLPLFQSLCLGKHAVVLNEHVHKDYCNEQNSVLVSSNKMIPAIDPPFFAKTGMANVGNWYDFDGDDAISGMEEAIKRCESSRVNTEGEKLKDSPIFSYNNTVNIISNTVQNGN